jgi:hypothetical protein
MRMGRNFIVPIVLLRPTLSAPLNFIGEFALRMGRRKGNAIVPGCGLIIPLRPADPSFLLGLGRWGR